eukprot:11650243-Alexandrium_andersonii.AAC.1
MGQDAWLARFWEVGVSPLESRGPYACAQAGSLLREPAPPPPPEARLGTDAPALASPWSLRRSSWCVFGRGKTGTWRAGPASPCRASPLL